MTAYPVPSSQRTNNPTVQGGDDEQRRIRKRVSILERPTRGRTRALVELDFGSISAGAVATADVAVDGARVGDFVVLGPPDSVDAGLVWSGFVSVDGTVTVRLLNTTGGSIDPAAADWKVGVIP